jgi:hypothetical protein
MMEDARPAPDSVSEVLKISLREGGVAGDYDTVAIVSNIRITDRETGNVVDAISISIDDRSSSPILCYVPYKLEHGVPILGDVKAGVGVRMAF